MYRLQPGPLEGLARVKHELVVGLRAILVDESDAPTRCIALYGYVPLLLFALVYIVVCECQQRH